MIRAALVSGVVLGVVLQVCAPVAGATEQLSWGPCPHEAHVAPETGALCATVSVPMSYTSPGGRSIELTVSRIPASGRRIGVLFANPGGPGGDALDFWSSRRTAMPDQLHEQFDEVAVQPRGLRWSTPLDCTPRGRALAMPAVFGQQITAGRSMCDANRPGYAATMTTENTARDADEVRRALGVAKISFLGVSYGTYLGAVYGTLFPEHTDKLVLDSSMHPDWVWLEQFARQQFARKPRLGDLLDWIAAHDTVYHLGTTKQLVYAEWVRQVSAQGSAALARLDPALGPAAALPAMVEQLLRDGLGVSDEQLGRLGNLARTLTQPAVGRTMGLTFAATHLATYTRVIWPFLAQGMREYRDNPRSTRFLDYLNSVVTGAPATQGWVFGAVTCNENAIAPKPATMATALGGFATGASVYDITAALVRSGATCLGWPSATRPVRLDGSRLATPPLILQSNRDSATPTEGGPAMAAAIGGRLIRVGGGDHGVFGRREPTLDAAVLRYLETGEVTLTDAPEAPIRVDNPPREVPCLPHC